MTPIELREKLRIDLLTRIAAGLITQTKLSTISKVRQPTISRFLKNAEISWSSATALMIALGIRVEDYLDSPTSFRDARRDQFIPLVKQITAAITPVITPNQVEQWTDISISSLGSSLVTGRGDRAFWTPFVAIDVTQDQITFMHPALRPHTRVVIDRHHQEALVMYQRRRAMYLVSGESPLRIGYLQKKGSKLEIHRLGVGTDEIRREDIVGRVCEVIVRSRV